MWQCLEVIGKEYIQEGEREGRSLLDAMRDGALDGMQSFDGELERLILAGIVDREVGLSFAANRTNLQLQLDSATDVSEMAPDAPAESGMDDLIER